MNKSLLDQWQRLILPPEGVQVQAGEQLRHDNKYPNADRIDWGKHQAGAKTYAVNLAWRDTSTGLDVCRAAVLDIDSPDDPAGSLTKARELLAVARGRGLSCLPAWSGKKGCHVWLFFDPCPVVLVKSALERLRADVPFHGDLIPGELYRVKLPPALHQVSRCWAFWLDPLPDAPPRLENPSEGFLAAQAGILAGVTPSLVEVVASAARTTVEAVKAAQARKPPEDDMQPHLDRLQGQPPACIGALVEQGAQGALGTWDKNALTLLRYCAAAGLSLDGEPALALLQTLVANTPDTFETTKDDAAKLKHWRSIKEPGPFRCGFMLSAKRALGFDCASCAAKPEGVRAGKRKQKAVSDNGNDAVSDNGLRLEPVLADALLALALREGQPPERIDPDIFPETEIPGAPNPEDNKTPLHMLAWCAIPAGVRTPAAMLNHLQEHHDPPAPHVCELLAALVDRLLGLSEPDEQERDALIARAVDLSARLALLKATGKASTETTARKPLADILGALSTETAQLQSDAGAAWGAPLTAHAAELLEGLVQTDRPTVPTPFETLNALLGGGLQGGKLYVLAAPPGGGKTTLSTQIADAAAEAQIPTCYCALEMGRPQLFDYALARRLGMNSAKVEARDYQRNETDTATLAQAAQDYLETVAPWLTVLEGTWNTTAATLAAWVAQARGRYRITAKAPVLIVVDYLQLLNTGDEKLDTGPNETPKVSTVSVHLKQLARDTGAAVLALSDIIKSEQRDAIRGQEFTLNMLRGSNRIAHAADVVLGLYSEASQADGGKAQLDPWELLGSKYQDSPRGGDFRRGLDDLAQAHPTGGPGACVHSRLELLKNRGGRGRGSQVLLYERAFHRFLGLSVPGQDAAEGRG